jgi:hypothetical protein
MGITLQDKPVMAENRPSYSLDIGQGMEEKT